MDPQYSSPLQKQRNKKFTQISITDKVSEAKIDDSIDNSDKRTQKYEKLVMGTAAAYKQLSHERKLYLPTLIKAVELDKKLKIVTSKTRTGNSVRISQEKSLKHPSVSSALDMHSSQKDIRLEGDELPSSKRRGSLFE